MTPTKKYDHLSRLAQIASTPSASPLISFAYAYNSSNQRTAATNADGTYWVYAYDALGQVTSGVNYFNKDVPVPGEQFGYAFDNIGNRTSTTEGGDQYGNNLRTSTYGANLNNQYTNRTVPGAVDILGSAVTNATVTVNNQATYRNGTFYEATLSLTNLSAAVWQSITNLAVAHTSSTTDLVATVTGNTFLQQTPEAFSYDSDGNLSQDGRWTYTWDGENRLIQMVSLTNAPTASKLRLTFNCDSKWRRISKAVEAFNGTSWTTNLAESFVYDGWNLVDELNATNNAAIRSYMWGLDLSGSIQGAGGVGGLILSRWGSDGPAQFNSCEANGNIIACLDAANGRVSIEFEFSPFGESLRPSSTALPLTLASKYGDIETQCTYYGFRYYTAKTADWSSRDPLGEYGSFNLQAFVHNDPINYLDYLGLKLIIEGPVDFQKRVRACLEALKKSKVGKKLHDGADNSPTIISFRPAPGTDGPYTGDGGGTINPIALDPTDPIFVGPDAPIRKHPDELPPYRPSDNASILKACACVLGHELGHVYYDYEDEPQGPNVKNVENPIRKDLGLPPRRHYHGLPVSGLR